MRRRQLDHGRLDIEAVPKVALGQVHAADVDAPVPARLGDGLAAGRRSRLMAAFQGENCPILHPLAAALKRG